MNWTHAARTLTLAALLAGCADETPDIAGDSSPAATATAADATTDRTETAPADAFLDMLRPLCGRAFAGLATGPSALESGLSEQSLTMHVRRCSENAVQIPLHIGDNRSRTWLLTRTGDGLRLKHDHRLPDGSDDAITQYGGDTTEAGSDRQQSFPADAFTAELIADGATNVWRMTIDPGTRFTYHLTRHGAPRATFTFDLTAEIEPPPAPWGYEET